MYPGVLRGSDHTRVSFDVGLDTTGTCAVAFGDDMSVKYAGGSNDDLRISWISVAVSAV